MRPDTGWNVLSLTAIAATLAAVGFWKLYPSTSTSQSIPPPIRSAAQIIDKANKESKESQDLIEEKEWSASPEALGGTILSQLSDSAEKKHVQVSDFRFDKSLSVDGLQEAPFTMVIEGEFGHVMDFVQGLEQSSSKLGLGMLQVTSSDKGQGYVKATMRLTAFIRGGI